jgi:microcystin-dependent protein
MATVDGITAARAIAIENAEIASGAVDANGHLILTKAGGGTIDAGSVVAPAGSVIMSAATVAPSGWLLCNGQEVSRTTYAALFAAIGTTYGVGNNTTTFNVPNLEAKFPRMEAAQRGATGGTAAHTHSETSHDHNLDGGSVAAHAQATWVSQAGAPNFFLTRIAAPAWTVLSGADISSFSNPGGTKSDGIKVAGRTANGTGTTTGSTSGLPPYQNLNFIIKT